jgi:plasmid maintenance system killer protein
MRLGAQARRTKKPTSGRPKIGTTIGAQFTSFDFLNRLSCPAVSSGKLRSNALTLPGWQLHPLKGHDPVRHAIAVNGPWRITFEFDKGDMFRVDFEQYH